MIIHDQQVGAPGILYKDTKANITALAGIAEGAVAYATDADEFGSYDGVTWTWGQNVSGGGGGDHLHGLARWNADGGTTFNLPDVAEYLEWATDNGSLQDDTTISLSADNTQLVFGSAPTAAHVLQAEYVIARV